MISQLKQFVPARIRHKAVPPLGHISPQYSPRPLTVPASYARSAAPENAPRISVVVPSLDYGRFLDATLASLVSQDYPNLELIVCDGGSTDGTVEVLGRHASEISALHEGDAGQADAINRGLAGSSGEIMAWLNADDLALPGSLAFVARYFESHPEVDVLYGNRVLINEDGDDVGLWVTPKHTDDSLQWFDFVPQEAAYWRRSVWERAGGVDTSFQYGFDWEMFLRFHRAGARFTRVPRFLGAFRQHEGQKTRQFQEPAQDELHRIRCAHHGRSVDLDEAQARAERVLLRAGPHHLLRKSAWRMPRRSVAINASPERGLANLRDAPGSLINARRRFATLPDSQADRVAEV